MMDSPVRDPSPATTATAEPTSAPVIFRAKRKRPTLRSRQEERGPDPSSPQAGVGDGAASKEDEADEQGVSVAEVLRQRRKQAKLRGAGVAPEYAFTTGEGLDESGEQSVVAAGERRAISPDVVMGGITGRFAPQTGLVGELVNRHM